MYATSGVQSQRSALLLCGALLYYSDQHTDLHRDDTKRTAVRVTGDHFCKCPCVCTAKKIENIKTEIKGFENHFISALPSWCRMHSSIEAASYRILHELQRNFAVDEHGIHTSNSHCYVVLIYFREFHMITGKFGKRHKSPARPSVQARPSCKVRAGYLGLCSLGSCRPSRTRHNLSGQSVCCLLVLMGKRF